MSYNGIPNQQNLASALGQYSQGSVGAGYPPPYQTAVYSTPLVPPFPYDHPTGCVGVFRVRKVENGYLVEYQLRAGDALKEYYAETLKDVGERIAALGVQKALEGGQP